MNRANMKKKKCARRQQITMAHFRKHDGGIDHMRILKMNKKCLRKLAEELGQRIPKEYTKQQIREQIISILISSSTEWKLWSIAKKTV